MPLGLPGGIVHWSAWDTRKPSYHVRYTVANNPTGPFDPSQFKILLQKDDE